MKPTVKVFTKDAPCTKLHIWNCFRQMSGYAKVQVDVAHSEIGLNVPRVMERGGKLVKETEPRGDYYVLTPLGKQWLEEGIRAYLTNHPGAKNKVKAMPPRAVVPAEAARVTRTRPAPAPARKRSRA